MPGRTNPRRVPRSLWNALGAALVVIGVGQSAAAAIFDYANPTTFSTLNSGTTTTFALGGNSVTATRLSTFTSANGLTLGAEVITFPSSSPSNPDWVAGVRNMFRLRFNDNGNTTNDGNVTVEYAFASPLSTASYLIFADFDVKESLKIQAYDSGNSLIPFASLSFARQNGRQVGGDSLTLPTWASEAGYSGVIAYGNNTSASWSDPVVTLQSSSPISRLVYESDNDPYDTVTNNDLYFNFATPSPTPVPEIDPAGTGAVLTLITGAIGILERRRMNRR